MSFLDATLNYKGIRINKVATSTGYFYRVRLVPFSMTSLDEAKREINKIIAKAESK
ncbi:MAG: hypothetical protein IPI16_17475 [Comamonadaceae bacterium]|nr:hypothetical protein [Comamonadaceae bacterium]